MKNVIKIAVLTVLICTVMACGAQRVNATCESGKTPSYGDINAVMFERGQGFWGSPSNPSLEDSVYWVFFWNIDSGGTYTQYSRRPDRGTYHLGIAFEQVVALLKKDQFYNLEPGEHLVADASPIFVTVRRCGVVTRLMTYAVPDLYDAKVNKLFQDFDALVSHAPKKRTSTDPQDFQYTLLFDN